MNSLQGYFFGVAEKHHGYEHDFIESMFETSFLGDVLIDDRGHPIWREHRPGEHELPDHPQRVDGPDQLDQYGWPKTEREGSTMAAAQPLTAAPPKPAAQSRMTLAAVTKGKVKKPHRVVGYGPEGIGKS